MSDLDMPKRLLNVNNVLLYSVFLIVTHTLLIAAPRVVTLIGKMETHVSSSM